MRKTVALLSLLAAMLVLSACSSEADFRSLVDTRGRSDTRFALGDQVSRFERNLVRRGVWVTVRETAAGTLETREYVRDGEPFAPIILVADFLNGRAVRMTIRPAGFEYFQLEHMAYNMTMDDARANGFTPCPRISRRYVRYFDASGNEATADDYVYRAWFSFNADGELLDMTLARN